MSLTVWVTREALAAWQPPRFGQCGRQRDYSEVVIETGYLLRSITVKLEIDVGVPDHATFSRRSSGLAFAASLAQAQANGPVHVVIDATGLKVYGTGEWLVAKHGERGMRTWRKLHLAVDPSTGQILASELTTNEEGDVFQVGPLLGQLPGPIASVTADGACDGDPTCCAVSERQPDPPMAVIVPPLSPRHAAAVPAQVDAESRDLRGSAPLRSGCPVSLALPRGGAGHPMTYTNARNG